MGEEREACAKAGECCCRVSGCRVSRRKVRLVPPSPTLYWRGRSGGTCEYPVLTEGSCGCAWDEKDGWGACHGWDGKVWDCCVCVRGGKGDCLISIVGL